MEVNPNKSEILRILGRKGKVGKIENPMNIPEVKSYTYLGVKIDQSLRLDEHQQNIKKIESSLRRKTQVCLQA
jgi:hypothetical protein